MKKAYTILILAVVCQSAVCQNKIGADTQVSGGIVHSLGDFSFAGSPNILINTPNGIQFAGGLKIRMFLGKRFSFDSDLMFGRDYIHGGPGIIGIPIWMFAMGSGNEDVESSWSDFLFKLAAMALSAEHMAYHVPVGTRADLSPYISLLRYKSAYEYGVYSETNRTNEQFSFATGLELNKYFKRLFLAPYVEWNIGYADHISGFYTGVYCGMFFLNKKGN
jgi:hypothetical protein